MTRLWLTPRDRNESNHGKTKSKTGRNMDHSSKSSNSERTVQDVVRRGLMASNRWISIASGMNPYPQHRIWTSHCLKSFIFSRELDKKLTENLAQSKRNVPKYEQSTLHFRLPKLEHYTSAISNRTTITSSIIPVSNEVSTFRRKVHLIRAADQEM